MKSEIEAAIKALLTKSKNAERAVEALQFTQAVLNIAQVSEIMGSKK